MSGNNKYFYILIKQLANLRSEAEAERVSRSISYALSINLDERTQNVLFSTIPQFKLSGVKFYSRIKKSKKQPFNYDLFLTQIMRLLNLTDPIEAKQYIKAYISAAVILAGESSKIRLGKLLPPELVNL